MIFKSLTPEANDSPFGEYTGAGTILELPAVLQKLQFVQLMNFATGEQLNDVDIKQMRGTSNRSRSIELDVKGTKLVVRVVSTLVEAEKRQFRKSKMVPQISKCLK